MCKKSFTTDSALENHQMKAHAPKVISYFECDFCESTIDSGKYMNDHLKSDHCAKDAAYKCVDCDYDWENPDSERCIMQSFIIKNLNAVYVII